MLGKIKTFGFIQKRFLSLKNLSYTQGLDSTVGYKDIIYKSPKFEPVMWYDRSFENHCQRLIRNVVSKKLSDKYYISQIINESNKSNVLMFKILEMPNFDKVSNIEYLLLKQYSQQKKSAKVLIEEFKDLEIDLIC